jgi:hypothetical protein
VVTSFKCGRFPTFKGESASKEDAKIGRAEFFAPEAYISPLRGSPPLMSNLSI